MSRGAPDPGQEETEQASRSWASWRENESGDRSRRARRQVVIVTGGFGDNPDMIKKYTGFELGKDLIWPLDSGVMATAFGWRGK